MTRRTAMTLLIAASLVAAGAGAAVAETTKYPTAFTKFKYKGGDDNFFKGEIDSSKGKCVSGRKVKLIRKKNGDKKKLGSDKTNGKGKFGIDLDGKAKNGTYYAEVDQVSYSSGGDKTVCLDRTSPKVKIS